MLSVHRFVLKSKQPETASEQACNGKDKCLLNLRIFSFIERLSFSNKETAVFLRCLQGIVICLQSKSTSELTLLNIFLCSQICSFACYSLNPIRKFIWANPDLYLKWFGTFDRLLPPTPQTAESDEYDEYGVGRIACLPASRQAVKLYLEHRLSRLRRLQ
jgi:hypothetical protein